MKGDEMRSVWCGIKRGLLLIAVFSFIASCAAVKPVPPEVSLTSLFVEGISLSHADLSAKLSIFNPNRVAMTIEQVDYTLQLEGIKVSDGRSFAPVRIGARESGDLDMKLSASYLSLWQVISSLADQENVKFSLNGSVLVGGLGVTKTFPLERVGTVSLKDLSLR
jgi:LEA14-like dessication related protein